MRPFEFPIPLRVLLRKLCAPIQALRLQRRDPPLVPSQTFLRLQQRPQPRRIRIIAPEFRITSRFQVVQPDDFRVARRAAAAAARRRLRLLTVCASFDTAVAPSVARRARHPRVSHPARPRARPRVFARVLARRSALDAPLPFAFAFAFALAVAVALTPRVAPVARADDDVARDVDARLATSRATRRHMFRDGFARRALTRRRVDRHYARVGGGVVVVARARRRARAPSARTARASRVPSSRARARRACAAAPRANVALDARANASVRATATRGAMPRARATRDEDARDGDGLLAKPLSASRALRARGVPGRRRRARGVFVWVSLRRRESGAGGAGERYRHRARRRGEGGRWCRACSWARRSGRSPRGASADKFGRKKSLALAGVALALGSAACAAATTLRAMLAGRAIAGVGVGLVSILVPMYVSELSPPEHRGVLGSGPQLSIGFGILVAMFLGLPLQGVDVDPAWWRTMFWVATVPAVALATLANGIPESPSWLRSKGQFQEADAVESKQFGAAAPTRADDMGSTKVATWQETLQGRSNRRAVITGPMLFFIQQFAGINAIIYFSTAIFQSAGIESGVLASVAVCVVNIVGSVIATGLLDKTGRKPLLMYSFLGMAVSCVGLAIAGAFPAMVMAPALSLFSVLSYVFIFGMGAGPVPGLLSSEIFAPAVRGKGMSLCFLAHWIFNFCIGQGFLPAVEYFGASVVYMFFAAFSMFGFFFTQAYVVETKGKSLEQIAVELHT